MGWGILGKFGESVRGCERQDTKRAKEGTPRRRGIRLGKNVRLPLGGLVRGCARFSVSEWVFGVSSREKCPFCRGVPDCALCVTVAHQIGVSIVVALVWRDNTSLKT